jgi:hypothetical protein
MPGRCDDERHLVVRSSNANVRPGTLLHKPGILSVRAVWRHFDRGHEHARVSAGLFVSSQRYRVFEALQGEP